MTKINTKKTLQTLEHIVLIAAVAGAVGFYTGNSYGTSHVDVKALKTAQTSK